MTDITAGQENDVSVGTDVNATSLNVQGTVSYVLSVRTQIPTIDGIEAHGGPGGQNLRTPGFGTNNGGAGVLGYGGDAGEFEDLHELLPPGPGVVGLGGSSPTDAANGAPGVIGVGSGGRTPIRPVQLASTGKAALEALALSARQDRLPLTAFRAMAPAAFPGSRATATRPITGPGYSAWAEARAPQG
jgi:hypothetical protein